MLNILEASGKPACAVGCGKEVRVFSHPPVPWLKVFSPNADAEILTPRTSEGGMGCLKR